MLRESPWEEGVPEPGKSEAAGKEMLFGFVHAEPFTEATQDQKGFEFLPVRSERAYVTPGTSIRNPLRLNC